MLVATASQVIIFVGGFAAGVVSVGLVLAMVLIFRRGRHD